MQHSVQKLGTPGLLFQQFHWCRLGEHASLTQRYTTLNPQDPWTWDERQAHGVRLHQGGCGCEGEFCRHPVECQNGWRMPEGHIKNLKVSQMKPLIYDLVWFPGGAKVPYARANGSGKYLKLLVSWESIQNFMLRKSIKFGFWIWTILWKITRESIGLWWNFGHPCTYNSNFFSLVVFGCY